MKNLKTAIMELWHLKEALGHLLVVLSLLLAGAILLEWITVEDPEILGYFLLAQGATWMTHNFNKQEK